jgi:hypothetical protein
MPGDARRHHQFAAPRHHRQVEPDHPAEVARPDAGREHELLGPHPAAAGVDGLDAVARHLEAGRLRLPQGGGTAVGGARDLAQGHQVGADDRLARAAEGAVQVGRQVGFERQHGGAVEMVHVEAVAAHAGRPLLQLVEGGRVLDEQQPAAGAVVDVAADVGHHLGIEPLALGRHGHDEAGLLGGDRDVAVAGARRAGGRHPPVDQHHPDAALRQVPGAGGADDPGAQDGDVGLDHRLRHGRFPSRSTPTRYR